MSPTFAYTLAVLIGAVLGLVMRRLMGRRIKLGWAESALSGIIGAAIGALAVSVLIGYARAHVIVLALAAAGSTILVMLVVGYFTRRPQPSVTEIIAAGENAHVEFKSTARCNLHTGERDDKIELAVVKTVAAFGNSGGGDLLIGVDDAGTPLGLDNDLKFMKVPDLDRFELWLRDHLTRTMGAAASSQVAVDFPRVDGRPVCHVHVLPATRPVFVAAGKGQPVAMYVRVGNSTRQLEVDEALRYAADRWERRRLR